MTVPADAAHATETPDQALARAQQAAQARRLGEARGICEDILARAGDHPGATGLLGLIRATQGDLTRGIALLERAAALAPDNPAWHANLCSTYQQACRAQDALRAGQQAVRMRPDSPEYLLGLALALVDLDQREQAAAYLLRAIGLRPDYAEAHLALGQTLLARGEMQPGWVEYEWRNRLDAPGNTLPKMTSAAWNGMRIPSGRILLVGDQGYGDTIQFARYIPLVAERCAEVILGCSAELAPLLARIPGVGQCIRRWDHIPGHAAHARLSSLPYLLRTELDTIPAHRPYLGADPGQAVAWATRLPAGVPRIGLAWSGRPTHPNDRRRSLRLRQLAPLGAAAPDAAFVSLQTPLPAGDADALPLFPGLFDNAGALTDFEATAAAIVNLDLVVTTDTAIAHLAGALGRPVWILLPQPSDWRWMVGRGDSPWYPSARLFRQPHPGAWSAVIADVASALTDEWIGGRRETVTAAPAA